MKFYFLGTGSSYPTPNRGVSALALQLESGQVWLFDCGEGTQIQLQKVTISRKRISKIFITHLHGDHLFGLPGLLCTISSQLCQTEEKNESMEHLVDIYGPLGLRKFIYTSLSLSRSPLMMKYRVHELEPVLDQFPDDWSDWNVDHNPPESLHPSELAGEILKPILDDDGNVSWKLFDDNLHSVEAGVIIHRIPSFGFVIKEKDKCGTLLVEKLKSFGIQPGPLYGKLKSGQDVKLNDGTEILASDVLGPSIKGRTVVICGDTCDASKMKHLISECDVLVHEATHDDNLLAKAQEFGHSTPSMAAKFCKDINAATLLLNHFSQRYSDKDTACDEGESIATLEKQALKCLEGSLSQVYCTRDLYIFNLERVKREQT